MTTYDPDVRPGMPAARLDLDGLTMWKLSVSDMHNNVYLIRDSHTGAAILVDAAADAAAIRRLLTDTGVERLEAIITTHKHWDHHRALPELAGLATVTMCGTADAGELPVVPDRMLDDGDSIAIGQQRLTAHHVPGHTPGSVVLSWTAPDGRAQIWTGDTLFPGGVGATDRFPDQDFETLFTSVTERIFGRFDDADVHPGHGTDTTLAAERPHLPQWRERGW